MPPIPVSKISELLSKVFHKRHDGEGDYLTIDEIMRLLHERGFGMMIVLFALPNLFPGFLPPIPTLFAVPLCFFSTQMIIGFDSPRLPGIIARRHIKRASLQKAITKSMPIMKRLESIIRPRMEYLVTDRSERYIGIFMLAFSISVAIPLPMTNFWPSVALLLMGIGLMSKDGLAVLIGIILGSCWIGALIVFGPKVIAWLS